MFWVCSDFVVVRVCLDLTFQKLDFCLILKHNVFDFNSTFWGLDFCCALKHNVFDFNSIFHKLCLCLVLEYNVFILDSVTLIVIDIVVFGGVIFS